MAVLVEFTLSTGAIVTSGSDRFFTHNFGQSSELQILGASEVISNKVYFPVTVDNDFSYIYAYDISTHGFDINIMYTNLAEVRDIHMYSDAFILTGEIESLGMGFMKKFISTDYFVSDIQTTTVTSPAFAQGYGSFSYSVDSSVRELSSIETTAPTIITPPNVSTLNTIVEDSTYSYLSDVQLPADEVDRLKLNQYASGKFTYDLACSDQGLTTIQYSFVESEVPSWLTINSTDGEVTADTAQLLSGGSGTSEVSYYVRNFFYRISQLGPLK